MHRTELSTFPADILIAGPDGAQSTTPQLHLRLLPAPAAAGGVSAKRLVDVSLGLLLLIVATPIVFIAALSVRLCDGGPAFYRQERVGKDGRRFSMIKLRSMVVGAERHLDALACHNLRQGPLFKLARDPRVTRVGRLLRATSIDELPQLVHVVSGRMSLVGPRPALPSEVERFDDELQAARHAVRPGITGLWQVEARDEVDFDRYRALDLHYVRTRTLHLDARILCITVDVVTRRSWRAARGAIARRGELTLGSGRTVRALGPRPSASLLD